MRRAEAVSTALRMILAGYGRFDIQEFLVTKSTRNPHPPRTPAEIIYEESLERIKDLPPGDDSTRLAYCQEITRSLLEKMIGAGDYDGALRAAKELGRLFDIYSVAREARANQEPSTPEPAIPEKSAKAVGDEPKTQIVDLTKLLEEVRGAGG